MATDIKDSVRVFIREELEWSGPDELLADDASLIDAGVLDSLNLLELGNWIGSHYGFKVDETDMIAANFETLGSIEAFVRRGTGA
ncbi:phosphopantetheine-binding protein [Kitasatospora purpeofusca]|uniref:phosphopantetheine-binding protein n=1 Tax=Kitasatospora purpeofusca TaxID=67352 RepID=UPI0038107484